MALTVTEDAPEMVEAPKLTEAVVDDPVAVEYPAPFYRVFTPVEDFDGTRIGQVFVKGEAVVDGKASVTYRNHHNEPVQESVLKLFEQELGYRVEAIPEGVPPVPTHVLSSAGVAY